MRRLLYCGEWIESHALHVFLLHAPDFLGYDGAIEMAADHPDVVERGLRLKKAGNDLMDAGRRPLDPPGQRAGRRLLPDADASPSCARSRPVLGAGAATTRSRRCGWSPGSTSPTSSSPTSTSSLRAEQRLPDRGRQRRDLLGQRLRRAGLPRAHRGVPRARTPTRCTPGSTADPSPYVVGPLARYTLNSDRLSRRSPSAAATRGRAGRRPAATRSGRSSCAPSSSSRPATRPCGSSTAGPAARPRACRCPPRAGRATAPARRRAACSSTATCSTTTASSATPRSCRRPRRTSPASRPTCAPWSRRWTDLDDHALQHRCEQAIRNYDPCISCATHFLDLTVDRGMTAAARAGRDPGRRARQRRPGRRRRRRRHVGPRGRGAALPAGRVVVEHEDPTALLDLWAGHDRVVVVDAVVLRRPGRARSTCRHRAGAAAAARAAGRAPAAGAPTPSGWPRRSSSARALRPAAGPRGRRRRGGRRASSHGAPLSPAVAAAVRAPSPPCGCRRHAGGRRREEVSARCASVRWRRCVAASAPAASAAVRVGTGAPPRCRC